MTLQQLLENKQNSDPRKDEEEIARAAKLIAERRRKRANDILFSIELAESGKVSYVEVR